MACCRIAPFDLLARLEREGTEAQQVAARRALAGTLPLRATRLDPALAPPAPATTAKRTVHDVARFDNAFWDGAEMVYGDGSGQLFVDAVTP